jgi:hypothetical protein
MNVDGIRTRDESGPSGSGAAVVVTTRLDEPLSRWLWLVKWLLLLPHYIVLAFLWIGVVVCWVIALFAILFTGRYPRPLFRYVLGVLRWSWRAGYYGYSALGTDRYPPFTLGEVPDYPARLDIAYPQRLSRGLVLVKWWLLAIPHYLVVGVLSGAVVTIGTHDGTRAGGPGLIGLLVLVGGVVLLFAAHFPSGLHALVVGLNRWVLRVLAYVLLLTDEYPPFTLDQGDADPAGSLAVAGA